MASTWAIVLKRSQSSIGALGVLEMDEKCFEFFFLKIRTVSYSEVFFFEVLFFFRNFFGMELSWIEMS